jgi:ubiquinone/menaquinone biosynthesis C-methylase UbiE
MRWFRKSAGEPLAVSMAGVKLGDRLLVVGVSDTALIATLAGKAGLTGRACMVADSESLRERAAAAVEQEGALIESVTAPASELPFDADSFDVVLIRNILGTLDADQRSRAVREVCRVVRPGGRCVVIDDTPRGGLAGLIGGRRSDSQYAERGGARSLLAAAGFRGVRTLAEREGLVFVEGVKAAVQA